MPQLAHKADNELFIAATHLDTSHGNCFSLWFSLWLCIPPGYPPSKLNKETVGPVITADEWVCTQLIFQWGGTAARKGGAVRWADRLLHYSEAYSVSLKRVTMKHNNCLLWNTENTSPAGIGNSDLFACLREPFAVHGSHVACLWLICDVLRLIQEQEIPIVPISGNLSCHAASV